MLEKEPFGQPKICSSILNMVRYARITLPITTTQTQSTRMAWSGANKHYCFYSHYRQQTTRTFSAYSDATCWISADCRPTMEPTAAVDTKS